MSKLYSAFIRFTELTDLTRDEDASAIDSYLGSFSTRFAAEEALKRVDLNDYNCDYCCYRDYIDEEDDCDEDHDTCMYTLRFIFEHESDVLLNFEEVKIVGDKALEIKGAQWNSSPHGIAFLAHQKMAQEK